MEVIFLGTGTGTPSVARGAPGLLIKIGWQVIIFDLGPGSIRRLPEAGLSCNDINSIFISHLHVDHVSDLAPFIFATKYIHDPRTRDLTVYGPIGIKEYYDKLVRLYENQIPSNNYILHIEELGNDKVEFDSFSIQTKRLPHFQNSIGFRLENDKGEVLVYSGDSDYCSELVELCMNASLLILECSFPEKLKGHLSPAYAGRVASEANVERLVLTHLYPICDQCDIISDLKNSFKGDIIIAHDLMKLIL